jgi:hypothetical protein
VGVGVEVAVGDGVSVGMIWVPVGTGEVVIVGGISVAVGVTGAAVFVIITGALEIVPWQAAKPREITQINNTKYSFDGKVFNIFYNQH